MPDGLMQGVAASEPALNRPRQVRSIRDTGAVDADDFFGDRFWGQVQVFSRLLRESQGVDGKGARTALDRAKQRLGARLLRPAEAPRNPQW
jgi:hypothetical protein